MPKTQQPIHIEIRANDRVFVTGMTGSGKTFLVRKLLRQLDRVVVIDSKDDLQGWHIQNADKDSWKQLEDGEHARIRVSKPPGVPDEVYWDEQLTRAYQLGNATIYVDEAAQIQDGARASQIVKDIWQRGRAFGVGGWSASQRPRQIPKLFISEAEHVFMFRLTLPEDRDYMSGILGAEVRDPIPSEDEHGFWYKSIRGHEPIYIKRLPKQFGGDEKEIDLEVESEHSS